MRNLVRIMSIAALMALVLVACDQHAVEPGKGPGFDNSFAKDGIVSLLDETCTTCCSTDGNGFRFPAVSGVVSFANLGNYCAWTPQEALFCVNEAAQVQFEGQFGSFVRGLNGWNVDLVPIGTSNWCDVLTGIEYEHNNPGTSPTCNSISPSNVVGANGSLFGASYGLGYYSYDPVNNVITSYDYDIVVWKDCDAGNATDVSTADLAYLLSVTAAPTPGAGGYFSNVDFSWTCVATTCE